MINKPDIIRYYSFLEQESTEVRAITIKNGKSQVMETVEVINEDDFVLFCEKWNKKANLYCGIHERTKGGTKTKDVKKIRIIALDIDAVHPVGDACTEEELGKCKTETLQMLEELSQKYGRPCVIMTGNGFQFLWKIRPIDVTDNNRNIIEKRIQQWIRTIITKYNSTNKKIDQIGDLARILKIPGTLSVKGNNTKERPFRISHFLEYADNFSDKLRDEIMFMEIEQHPIQQKQPTKHNINRNHWGRFDMLLKRDSKLNHLYGGNTTGYSSRSEAELALICKLLYYEFSEGEIDLIMRDCGIGKWITSNRQYKELTLSKAQLNIYQKKQGSQSIDLDDVYSVLNKWLYLKDKYMVDLLLAVVLSQQLSEKYPLWIIFVGASGCGKSELLKTVDNLPFMYKVDQLTPNTFISGNPKVDDLAPQLNQKLVIISDFASILSLNGDAQRSIFSQLRTLYDGEAFKDTGAGARKHYSNLRITLMANSTPIIENKLLIHQELGTRELIYRSDYSDTHDDMEQKALRALKNEDKLVEMRKEICSSIMQFISHVKYKEVELTDEMRDWLLEKSKYLSLMRSTASIDPYTSELITDVTPEVPTRLIIQLKIIYCCLKNLKESYSDDRAKEIILRIINSSAKRIRVRIAEYLSSCDGEQTTSQIAERLRLGKKTVVRECSTLWNLGLIDCRKERTINFGKENEISYWTKKREREKKQKTKLEVLVDIIKEYPERNLTRIIDMLGEDFIAEQKKIGRLYEPKSGTLLINSTFEMEERIDDGAKNEIEPKTI